MIAADGEPWAAGSAAAGVLVDQLVRQGVQHFCVCPGSRSTPLALAIAQHPRARLWMHLDERSAAFFGLGMARALRQPVAIACTSGTAAANFLPAVVEAYYGHVPLLVLTADRPPELRERGAPQTIDQVNLYGRQVKWFSDLPVPDTTERGLRHLRTVAARAVATACAAPSGPVHLNLPYREPLVPPAGHGLPPPDAICVNKLPVAVTPGLPLPTAAALRALATDLASTPRGLIVCGPQDDPALAEPLVALAGLLGFPVLADPLSQVRRGPHHQQANLIDAYDAFLRDAAFVENQAPQLVLRLGSLPTSKALLLYLQRHQGCRHIVVDSGGRWNDPANLATDMITADCASLCAALTTLLATGHPTSPIMGSWLRLWRRANGLARQALTDQLEGLAEPFEGKVFALLGDLLPDEAILYVGNSMPVRDLDTFFPAGERAVRCLANRGANGIDGVVSSALGASVAGKPTVLVIGDISLYHDSNGLLAAKQHGLNATIVVLNNDGGGIFSFLPQAEDTEHFERLFGTPHGLRFAPLAEMYGATFTQARDWPEFRDALTRGMSRGGLHIVEVRTERQRNVELHREMWQAVSMALAAGLVEEGAAPR